jgi:hypothetical protein
VIGEDETVLEKFHLKNFAYINISYFSKREKVWELVLKA